MVPRSRRTHNMARSQDCNPSTCRCRKMLSASHSGQSGKLLSSMPLPVQFDIHLSVAFCADASLRSAATRPVVSVRPRRQQAATAAQPTPTLTIDASRFAESASSREAARSVPTPARLRAPGGLTNAAGVPSQPPAQPSRTGSPASPLPPSEALPEASVARAISSSAEKNMISAARSPPAPAADSIQVLEASVHGQGQLLCQPGSFYGAASRACSPCTAGHFADVAGALRCVVRLPLVAGASLRTHSHLRFMCAGNKHYKWDAATLAGSSSPP